MQGVTILTTEQIHSPLGWIIFMIILLIGMGIWGCVVCKNETDTTDITFGGALIGASVAFSMMLIIMMLTTNYSAYTKYIGAIDDSVPYVEFVEKYELIEQKDDLVIFRDKK